MACFHQISSELAQDGEQANWTRGECSRASPRHHFDQRLSDFKSRCHGKLEDLGDSAANAKQYDEAVSQYTAALSLDLARPQGLLIKRSNAWMGKDAREDAVNDVKEWARLMLISGPWKDALAAAIDVSILLP